MRGKGRPADEAVQLPLSFSAPTITPNGAGGFIVTPGKPLFWLTPLQFGKALGISRSSVYNLIARGVLVKVSRPLPRKIMIDASEVPRFRELIADPEYWLSRKF